jgi:outer membrane protein OmpA-like peptidoglycan-associated protein
MRARLAAAAAMGLVSCLTGAARADVTPTPAASWPEVGKGAGPATPRPINSQPAGTLQELRKPYTPVEETTEGGQKALTVSADVLFKSGSADLSGASQSYIQGLVGKLQAAGATGEVKVVGHTDDVGDPEANKRLSQQRAEAVRQVMQGLIANTGITLVAEGKGETEPRVKDTTPQAREKNRRVTILYGQAPPAGTPATPNTTSIAVPSTDPAPNPGLGPLVGEPAPLASTQRTIELPGVRWTVRFDVVEFTRAKRLLKVGYRVRMVDQQGAQPLDYGSLFSGDTMTRNGYWAAVLDKTGGEELDAVITGKGWALRDYADDADVGTVRYGWAYFSGPSKSPGTLSFYVPAFGTLDGLRLR